MNRKEIFYKFISILYASIMTLIRSIFMIAGVVCIFLMAAITWGLIGKKKS